MDVNVAAAELVRWAKNNRMFGNTVERQVIDPSIIRQVLGAVGVPSAMSVLQDRGISYIAVNEPEQAIYIFCQKAPRLRDRRMFEATTGTEFPIVLAQGGICSAGEPPILPKVAPFERYGGRYTCGSSVHLSTQGGAGTLGCLVSDNSGTLFALSNNHVFGDSNYAEMALPIFGPGSVDIAPGQPDPIVIGHLAAIAPLVDGLHFPPSMHNLDAALAKVREPDQVTSMQRTLYDSPVATAPLTGGMRVEKVGRTTGRTKGIVRGQSAGPAPVEYTARGGVGRKWVYFDNVFVIEGEDGRPFSQRGDSGSLITTEAPDGGRLAVGLLFAGDGNITLSVPISLVLNHFGVTLVSGHNI
jgi:hypothetical protein